MNTNKLAPLICIKPISAEAVPACLGNKLNARPADEPSVSAKPNAAINIGNINASAVRCWLKANIKAPAITSNKSPAFNARLGLAFDIQWHNKACNNAQHCITSKPKSEVGHTAI